MSSPPPVASHSLDVQMGAGRLLVRADPAVTAVVVVGIRAKLATDRRAAEAAETASVDYADGCVHVRVEEPPGRGRSPQVMVEVAVPEGASVRAEAAEAEIICVGRVADLSARTVSGSIHAEHVSGPLNVRTGRGPVTVHLCQGPAEVTVADAGVIVRHCAAPLRVNGRSGDVDIWHLAASADLGTTTGNLRVGWTRDRPVRLDISSGTGKLQVDVANDPAATDVLAVRTISGDVRVVPTAP